MPEETPQLPVSPQETQIEAPSFIDKIKLQKKKILIGLGVFLGVLILAGVVFGVYKYTQNQIPLEPAEGSTPTLIATPTPDPTTDWKTYTNTEYGYSIKYPQNVTVTTDAVQDLVSFKFPEEGKWVADLSIRYYQNPESLGPQSFWQKVFNEGKLEAQKNNWPPPSDPVESKIIKINNLEGFQVRNIAYEAYQRITYLGQKKIMVAISFYDENTNDPAKEEHLVAFNLMLSTFKFLEEENFESRKTSLLNAINTYLKALIVDKDWEKAKSYLSVSVYSSYKDISGPTQYVNYEILNEYHSTEEEMNFYNQQEPTFDVKFYEDGDPTGTRVSIKFFQENGKWKTNAWFSKE